MLTAYGEEKGDLNNIHMDIDLKPDRIATAVYPTMSLQEPARRCGRRLQPMDASAVTAVRPRSVARASWHIWGEAQNVAACAFPLPHRDTAG